MRSFYNIVDVIKEYLENNDYVNTVTIGDILQVDLNKQTIFPLSHMTIKDVVFSDHTIEFTIGVMAIDIVDQAYTDPKSLPDAFYGNNNLQDILNTQLTVLNGLQATLRHGNSIQGDYVIDSDLRAEVVEEELENLLAGWRMDIVIEVPNNSISTCE